MFAGDRREISAARALHRVAILMLVTLGLSCSQPEPASFVLITIDTLRADHLGAYGYFRPTSPTIDQLAKEGVVFENAIAPMATTLPSHTSLMTSTYPVRHGILSNLENGIIQHGWIYNAQIRIPLIMRFPDGRRGRVTQIASLIDVLPTLAEEAGLPLDTKYFDGVNLFREKREFALSQREHRKPAWVDLNLALTSLDWKYQLFEGGEDLLIDIRKDPHETRNVLDEYPMMADRMRREIMALVVENGARSPLAVRDSIPPIVIEQLRSLGYVE